MAVQLSTAVRNARLDAIESTIGTSPLLRIRTGTIPANCAAARTGTILTSLSLPSDWMSAASGGSKSLLGTWSGTAAASGTATYFEIMNTSGSVCGLQGSVSVSGGGGDMILDSVTFTSGQAFAVITFTLTDANA